MSRYASCLDHRTGPLWPAIRASRVATQRTFQAAPKHTQLSQHTSDEQQGHEPRHSLIGKPNAADPTPCRNPDAGATGNGTPWNQFKQNPHHHSVIGICGFQGPRHLETHAALTQTKKQKTQAHTARVRYVRSYLQAPIQNLSARLPGPKVTPPSETNPSDAISGTLPAICRSK